MIGVWNRYGVRYRGGWGEVHVHTLIAPHCLFRKSRLKKVEIALLGGKNERIGDGTQRFPLTGWRS